MYYKIVATMDKSSMDSKFYAILVCQFIVMRYFFKKLKDLKERERYIYIHVRNVHALSPLDR